MSHDLNLTVPTPTGKESMFSGWRTHLSSFIPLKHFALIFITAHYFSDTEENKNILLDGVIESFIERGRKAEYVATSVPDGHVMLNKQLVEVRAVVYASKPIPYNECIANLFRTVQYGSEQWSDIVSEISVIFDRLFEFYTQNKLIDQQLKYQGGQYSHCEIHPEIIENAIRISLRSDNVRQVKMYEDPQFQQFIGYSEETQN